MILWSKYIYIFKVIQINAIIILSIKKSTKQNESGLFSSAT